MSKSDLFSYMTIFKTLQETMDGLHLNMYHRNKLNIILRDTIQSAFDQFMFHKVALKGELCSSGNGENKDEEDHCFQNVVLSTPVNTISCRRLIVHERYLDRHLIPSTFPLERGCIQHFCDSRHLRQKPLNPEQYTKSIQEIRKFVKIADELQNAGQWNQLVVAVKQTFQYTLTVDMTDELKQDLVRLHQISLLIKSKSKSSKPFVLLAFLFRHWKRQLFNQINAPNAVTSYRRMPLRQQTSKLLQLECQHNHIPEDRLDASGIEDFIFNALQPNARTMCSYTEAMMKVTMVIHHLPAKQHTGMLRTEIIQQLHDLIKAQDYDNFLKKIETLFIFFKEKCFKIGNR